MPGTGPVHSTADGIVGRRRELDSLRRWLDGARQGIGQLVLCTGEPGIGKTRLAQELSGIALAGGTAVASIDRFDAVMSQLGGEPEGLEARYVGTTGDELRVVTIWESKAHADRFFAERLGPALAKALGPEPVGTPTILGIDVARTYVRRLVA